MKNILNLAMKNILRNINSAVLSRNINFAEFDKHTGGEPGLEPVRH